MKNEPPPCDSIARTYDGFKRNHDARKPASMFARLNKHLGKQRSASALRKGALQTVKKPGGESLRMSQPSRASIKSGGVYAGFATISSEGSLPPPRRRNCFLAVPAPGNTQHFSGNCVGVAVAGELAPPSTSLFDKQRSASALRKGAPSAYAAPHTGRAGEASLTCPCPRPAACR